MLKSEGSNMKFSDGKNMFETGGDIFEDIPEGN
jgi:hypothetical protein